MSDNAIALAHSACHAGGRIRIFDIPQRYFRIWLYCFAAGALALCLVTPPFETPDEPQHFYRAFQLSELRWRGQIRDVAAGTEIPSSLPELVEHFTGTRKSHVTRSLHPYPWRATMAGFSRPLAPEQREFVVFTEGITYAPIGYVPQALGIAIGRQLNLPPLGLLYAGRLANAALAILMTALAVRAMPIGGLGLTAGATLPMWLFLTGSLSQDVVLLWAASWSTVFGLRACRNGCWTGRDLAGAAAAGMVAATIKPAYLPLLLLGLSACVVPDPRAGLRIRSRLLLAHLLVLAASALVAVAWLHAVADMASLPRNGPQSVAANQAAFILAHPLYFVWVLAKSLGIYAGSFIETAVGILGWLTIRLPWPLYLLALGNVLLSTTWRGPNETPLSPRACWFAMLVAGACVALIMASLYMLWTPTGFGRVEGVQGRYFLPLLPLLSAVLASVAGQRIAWLRWVSPATVVPAAVLVTGGTLAVVIHAFAVLG